jgi:hypothetical protein
LRRFTFTGNTPSGATLTGALIDSTLPAKNSNWDVRTAATGMVITEAGDICSFFPVTAITAVGACAASVDNLLFEPDEAVILRAGEGIMVKQADAGTASDTRRFSLDLLLEEFTLQ